MFKYLIRVPDKENKKSKSELNEEDKAVFRYLYEYTYKIEGECLKCSYEDAGWE